jgi:hypothetical protein
MQDCFGGCWARLASYARAPVLLLCMGPTHFHNSVLQPVGRGSIVRTQKMLMCATVVVSAT